MSQTLQEKNKALLIGAFDTLFNKRDYEAAKRYWSPNYIQHSAHIEPSRDGLFNLVRSAPPTLKYEPGLIVAEGDFVIIHGRFSGRGSSVNWIAADIVRIENGFFKNTGMCFRTRQPRNSPRAKHRCSGRVSRNEWSCLI